MTTKQVNIRRDTATNLAAATPAEGELGYDKTNKRLVAGDGSTAGGIPHASAKDVQNQTFGYQSAGGTGNAPTITNTPPISGYGAGQKFTFKATAANTGAVQVNVDGKGLKDVKKMNNNALAALVANDIISGGIYDIFYDGTQFQIKGLSEGPFSAGALKWLGTVTASSSSTVDLTSLLSSTYDDYLIVFENVLPNAATTSLLMRFSPDNSTFDAGSNYADKSLLNGSSYSGGGTAIDLTNGQADSNTTTGGISGQVMLYGVNTSAKHKRVTGQTAFRSSSGATQTIISGHWINTTDTIQAVRFLMNTNTIVSGTFRVYGVAKS